MIYGQGNIKQNEWVECVSKQIHGGLKKLNFLQSRQPADTILTTAANLLWKENCNMARASLKSKGQQI